MSPGPQDPARVGPFYTPRNVTADPTLGGITRVLIMPVAGGTAAPEESAADFDPVFVRALQEQNRFEVVVLSRQECQRRFGARSLSSAAALPHNFVEVVKGAFGADAVLFVDVTVFRPYHPIALGVRSRLVTLSSNRLVWAFDNVFASDEARVANSARHFYLESGHQGVPGDLTPAVLQSPGRFAAYVAATTFGTLPPVTLGIKQESSSRRR